MAKVFDNWNRLVRATLRRKQLRVAGQSHERKSSSGLVSAVPASLQRTTNMDAILQAADEIQAEDAHVARILCEQAYTMAQNLDPNSDGIGVLQFKTGLTTVIKQKLAKKDGSEIERSRDAQYLWDFYQRYKRRHRVDEIQREEQKLIETGTFSADMDGMGFRSRETKKVFTTLRVLVEVMEALCKDVDPDGIGRYIIEEKYRGLSHLAIGLEEILFATNNFDDENLIKDCGIGKDYKGQMSRSGKVIDICARRFKRKHGQRDIDFWTEISMLSTLKHKNIISLVGFCEEEDEKIIIYEHAVHGSLDQHLSGPYLTWFQRLKICLGVAYGLNYIHYDVVHCDINSSKILLDKDWEPKIYGFEISTKYPQSWRRRLLSSHSFDSTNMTPKYDVYCFGVLLFEVLYAVKPTKTQPQGTINPNLREQMDAQSLTFFTNIIDKCLIEHSVQRPTMDQVVKKLEDVFELQWKHQNLEHSTAADKDEGTSSGLLKLELSDIRRATNGFDEAHFVASGGYGIVYRGELDVLDIQSSSTEGKRSNSKTSVAIKCIKNKEDKNSKQGFLREIELLTSCKHQNVISLLGLYMEADDIMLVYEYASKGSLSDYLRSTRKNINLTWGKRLEICLDVARGISYLHTSMEGKPRIIHRDIKSDNILLDENLNAKIADFGLSKFHSTNQQPRSTVQTKTIVGTDFYVDPEFATSGKYKKESDIYSFGVVMFEMLSGRLAYEQICTQENDKGLAPIARY